MWTVQSFDSTEYGQYTVWAVHSVNSTHYDNTKCGQYTVWLVQCVDTTQCGSYRLWIFKGVDSPKLMKHITQRTHYMVKSKHTGPYGTIQDYTGPYETIRAIRYHKGPYGTIRDPMEP